MGFYLFTRKRHSDSLPNEIGGIYGPYDARENSVRPDFKGRTDMNPEGTELEGLNHYETTVTVDRWIPEKVIHLMVR